jgi:hypothetical protein
VVTWIRAEQTAWNSRSLAEFAHPLGTSIEDGGIDRSTRLVHDPAHGGIEHLVKQHVEPGTVKRRQRRRSCDRRSE